MGSCNPRSRKIGWDAEIMQIGHLSILAMAMFPMANMLWKMLQDRGRKTVPTKKSLLQALCRELDHLSHIFKCPNSPRVELKSKSVYSMAFRGTFSYFFSYIS